MTAISHHVTRFQSDVVASDRLNSAILYNTSCKMPRPVSPVSLPCVSFSRNLCGFIKLMPIFHKVNFSPATVHIEKLQLAH